MKDEADKCMWCDKPCTCGGGNCEQVSFGQEPETVEAEVLAEHNGCGSGLQVEQLTVRLAPGDTVYVVRSAIGKVLAPAKGRIIQLPASPTHAEVTDEMAILRRLADGDAIVYSQDGDDCWFSKGDRARIAEKAVISLRDKGYIERRADAGDDTDNYRGMAEYDAISPAGRAALPASPTQQDRREA